MSAPSAVIMCLGTSSHAGKSTLAAALCRIYARRGYRVAPFKAQNMALNSYVTADGGEIGRSQAYQARAAGIEAHVDMNPVLLKPTVGHRSQVIVLGRPVADMNVPDYHSYQETVWPVVTAALDRLRAANDLVVLEGAGSPAEINLRDKDVVNMKVAGYAASPVLLVGDIDRGGVFAALVGHMTLFGAAERQLVQGFVINKFRGDASQLGPGIDELQQLTGVPTLGVVPVLEDWRGDDEDSLGIDDRRGRQKAAAPLRIAVVRLPHVSNFTDLDVLADEPDVDVRYVDRPAELSDVAAIVLPGTKSTIADLAWLRARGLAQAIAAAAAGGTAIVGICGGYQMLGTGIADPEHVESAEGEVRGLGLLDVTTVFSREKRTRRVEGEVAGARVSSYDGCVRGAVAGLDGSQAAAAGCPLDLGPAGTPVRGYEIHMGSSMRARGTAPLFRLWPSAGGERAAGDAYEGGAYEDGAISPDGGVCGSYVHGLFDAPELRGAFLDRLRRRHGLPPRGASEPADDGIDRLADHVEAHLDMASLERIIGLERREL